MASLTYAGVSMNDKQNHNSDNDVCISLDEQGSPKMSKEKMLGCMRGQFKMADDFDAPLEDFKEHME